MALPPTPFYEWCRGTPSEVYRRLARAKLLTEHARANRDECIRAAEAFLAAEREAIRRSQGHPVMAGPNMSDRWVMHVESWRDRTKPLPPLPRRRRGLLVIACVLVLAAVAIAAIVFAR